MRVGLCFDGFYSIQEMIELAQLADDIGMDSIWMSDHLCFRDSLTTAMALRQRAGAGDREPWDRQCGGAKRSGHRLAASAADDARVCRHPAALFER
ncbi:MAG: LM class flavin-dependent oxidoreductase [Deltaproteobacteria bacterium]|nr:LM class flavin-dependent oxidoreductase [Deltaproteobacteria bacterium]